MDPKTENFQMELEYMLTLDDMNLLLRNLMIRDELMSRRLQNSLMKMSHKYRKTKESYDEHRGRLKALENEENMNESVLKDEETKSVTFSKHIQEVEDHLREIRLSNARLTTELDSIRSEIIQVKSQLHETEQQLEENLAKEASLNRLISNLISEVERAKTNVLQTQKIFAEQENQLKLRRIEEMKTSAMVVQSRKELEQLKRSFKPKSIWTKEMPDDWQKNLATEVDSMQSNTRGNLLTEIQFEAMRKKNLSIQKDRVTSELLSMKSRINQAQLKCRNLSTDIQHRLSENMECDRKLCEAETDASHVKMKNESLDISLSKHKLPVLTAENDENFGLTESNEFFQKLEKLRIRLIEKEAATETWQSTLQDMDVEIQQLMVKKDRLRKIHSNSTIPEDPVQKNPTIPTCSLVVEGKCIRQTTEECQMPLSQ